MWLAGLVLVLGFLGWALFRNITLPWVEDDNWYGAVYSQAAHVNLEAGMLRTAGVPVTLYFGPLPAPAKEFYVHHPTLLPTLVTVSFAVFGESEWAARLVPVVGSLASVVLLWLLVRSAVNARAATLAAAFFATLPMELHYGDMVDFEPCLLMCMLAVLVCVRRWQVTGRRAWAVLAGVATMATLWMDWPGYLFVLSLAGCFILRGWKGDGGAATDVVITKPQSLRFGLVLFGLVGISGVIFLLQIRHVRPDAWHDLWEAATRRLSSTTANDPAELAGQAAHFTFREWCVAILRGLNADFLRLPWLFVALGMAVVWKGRRSDAGLRWCGFAIVPMLLAGVLYVVILRNESFVHDFATFYLIGAFAIAAGVGLDALLAHLTPRRGSAALHTVIALASLAFFTCLGVNGISRAESLRSPFSILDWEHPEPPDFIPSLGRYLGKVFPPGTTILCNFVTNESVDYYAQRDVVNGLMTASDWASAIGKRRPPLGGIIWLGAEGGGEIAASLPPGETRAFAFQGYRLHALAGEAGVGRISAGPRSLAEWSRCRVS